jgi:hypothetical protein
VGIASAIAKLAFLGLLIAGVISGELRTKGLAIFVALGGLAWFGLPYLPRGADFVTPALAVIDVVLVFVVYKDDIRIP